MDYFNNVLTTFLGLEHVSCIAVYGGFGMTWGWVINETISFFGWTVSFWKPCIIGSYTLVYWLISSQRDFQARPKVSFDLVTCLSSLLKTTSPKERLIPKSDIISPNFVLFCVPQKRVIQNIKAALFHTVEVNGNKHARQSVVHTKLSHDFWRLKITIWKTIMIIFYRTLVTFSST